MKFTKTYPFNLITDLFGQDFHSELSEAELLVAVEKLLLSLSQLYVVNKHTPQRMQAVIHFWYVEGLSYREIGSLLGVSSSRIGQIKLKALRLMRHPSRLAFLRLSPKPSDTQE